MSKQERYIPGSVITGSIHVEDYPEEMLKPLGLKAREQGSTVPGFVGTRDNKGRLVSAAAMQTVRYWDELLQSVKDGEAKVKDDSLIATILVHRIQKAKTK